MARIVIVGAGVVGQATGKGFAKKGHRVSYVDINHQTIERLRAIGLDAATAAELEWRAVDVVMLAVSTPSVDDRVVLDYIEAAALDIGRGIAQAEQFVSVVVRSTVPPTTTQQRITPILERASGKRAGVDFGVAMNPEFLRAISSDQDFARPWVTVLGTSDHHTADILADLYAPFGALIVRCSPTEAEMIKYVNNVYNAVKISYFNEVHAICEQLGINSNLVGAAVARTAESMWNPLYGTRGGVPYGGACLPKDTMAFLQFAQELGVEQQLLEATINVNRRLAASVPAAASADKVDEVREALRQQDATTVESLSLEVGGTPAIVL